MKRFLAAAAIVVTASAIHAQTNGERDVLLTPAGTLFTIESQLAPGDAELRRHLVMTAQNGEDKQQTIVPESLTAGFRCAPALTYDAETDTVFVFFLRMPNLMSSELLFASYRDGRWTAPISIDNQSFRLRSNLHISVRRRVSQPQADGTSVDVPALVVHTVWWEQSGAGEEARYALVAFEKGAVSNIELHDLRELAPQAAAVSVDPGFNTEILRYPAILDNGTANSIDVFFGDVRTNTFTRTTLKPIAQGKIHIPIGNRGGAPIGPPRAFSANWSGSISAISGGSGKLLLYAASDDSVRYIVYENGEWSAVRTLAVNEKLSRESAISVLGRMMSASQ
jgi:hypothetical protein